jgi:hypothetical protein
MTTERSIRTGWKERLAAGGGSVRILWLVGPAVLWAWDYGCKRHNNYKIFKHVWWHVLERRNLYLAYPAEYGDSNHYGPLFSLVIAPFALLPDAAGGMLWNVAMAMLLFWAIGRLGLPPERRVLLLLVCSIELLNAAWSNQFNPAIAAFLLLTFADVEEGRDLRAPLWSLVGAFVKVYSLGGLVFLLFARDRRAFLVGCVVWSVVLLLAPMLISSPEYILQSYRDWFGALVEKDGLNAALYTSQDISIPGLVRRAIGLPLPGVWFLLAGFALLLAPLLRVSQYRHRQFRILTLGSLLMFIVLFSSGSESATYVICATGAGLWVALQDEPFRPRNVLLLAALLIAGLAPTDLLSRPVRVVTNSFALKAIPFAAVWFLLCRDLLTRDFGLECTSAPHAAAWPAAVRPRE